MPTRKQAAASGGEPAASRPIIPREYGVPKSNKGLLPWSHVDQRMRAAKVYWVTVVSPAGRPHATPVDGVWLDGALYFGGDPRTRRQRYLMTNSAASVHLESGHDVVTMNGEVELAASLPPHVAAVLANESNAKYGYGGGADDYVERGAAVFRPREVFAWSNGLANATRWRFAR
jgi:hypothetical protein